ncbi:putative colanic acid biosynthesis acetyltransferase [Zavarzinia sp. CC-PAN008]|uniref:putative colanic acid biosynthesis acetyltransferase n=1 Tax=Zavarzinia sp. CC-PAN008 TaxID=3243332 RepID=UPI003F74786B
MAEPPDPTAPDPTVQVRYQDLRTSRIPPGFRGRHAVIVQLWWMVQATLFRLSPQVLYGWRAFLLRLFGAKVGKGVILRPTVTVTYPWKVEIGDHSWIGDDAVIYSLGPIRIGNDTVVSQSCYLCAGTHDYTDPSFPISGPPIVIEDQVWLAADVFVAPGVTVHRGAVVTARSTVTRDMPPGMICIGNPAVPVRPRKSRVQR